MSKKTSPRIFSSVLDEDTKPATKPTAKAPQLNMIVTPELKKRLERAIFWKGKGSNQLKYLTAAVQAALDADPDANRPMPGEED